MTSIWRRPHKLLFSSVGALLALLLLWPAERLRSENFVVYLPNQRKLIPMENIGGVPYLPLLPLISLRGPLSQLQEKRTSLKVRVGADQLQIRSNRNKIQINKVTVTLPEPVVRLNGQWMVPASFISGVLPQISGEPILYRPGTDRLFAGNVRPLSYAVHLQPLPAGARLVIQFTGAVTAQSAASNGKWLLYLGDAPVEPMEPVIQFQNPYVKEVRFDDQDGRPKLVISPGVEGMNFYPVLAPDRQELIADFRLPPGAAPPQSASAPPAPRPGPASAAQAGKQAAPGAQVSAARPAPPPLPAVVLDAGHGGADAGAHSRDGVLEKNVAAAIVQQTASDLNATHQYRVVLARSGDSDPSIEQRTVTANLTRPVAFISVHAGDTGDRSPTLRVYTYESPPPVPESSTPPAPSLFVPWDAAQGQALGRSQQLAADLARHFAAIEGAAGLAPIPAPVRQLRSVAAPAVAIEVGSLSPAEGAGPLAEPAFQKQVADAAAAAIEQFTHGGATR